MGGPLLRAEKGREEGREGEERSLRREEPQERRSGEGKSREEKREGQPRKRQTGEPIVSNVVWRKGERGMPSYREERISTSALADLEAFLLSRDEARAASSTSPRPPPASSPSPTARAR